MHTVRRATTGDVPFLVDVVVAATRAQDRLADDFDEEEFRTGFAAWTAEQIADADADSTTSVIELADRPVGRLRVVRTASTLELAGLQILPDAQSQGLGSKIVAELIAEATSSARALSLTVERDNPRARDLYVRLGFVEFLRSEAEVVMLYTGDGHGRG